MKRRTLCPVIIALIPFLLFSYFEAHSQSTDNKSLKTSFADIFAAEFDNKQLARTAWSNFGGKALEKAEKEIYPLISRQLFEENALKHLRSAMAAKPDLSPEQLSFIALEGLSPATQEDQYKPDIVVGFSKDHKRIAGYRTWVLSEDKPKKDKDFETSAYYRSTTEFDIPVLMVSGFTKTTLSKQLAKQLRTHKGKIILDLRGNEGGLLVSAVDLAALFIGTKTTVFMMEKKTGIEKGFRSFRKLSKINSKNLLVLIDEKTNGGALVVAAALKDYGLAKIAGKLTEGIQDRVFTIFPVLNCAKPVDICALKIPTGILLSSTGKSLKIAVKIDYPINWANEDANKLVIEKWSESQRQ